jgi:hypothetical protein
MRDDGAPVTAAECLMARAMIGEVTAALDDLHAAGVTGSHFQVLRANRDCDHWESRPRQ